MTLGRHSRGPLLALAGLLVALVVVVGVTSGFGGPSLPDGAAANVEEVSNGEITREEFEGGLETAAARQGVRQVPEEGTPQYDLVADEAMADLLLGRWVRGEAEERGIEVTDTEVDRELQQIIDQQFGSRQQFDRFLEQNAFTEEEALERVELQLLSQGIQEEAVPEGIEVSDEEIETYYDENIEQFQTPETRDVRTILTPDEAEAEEALSELEADDSPRSWEAVAEEFSRARTNPSSTRRSSPRPRASWSARSRPTAASTSSRSSPSSPRARSRSTRRPAARSSRRSSPSASRSSPRRSRRTSSRSGARAPSARTTS
jgi:parvulin-like peptidyl-prolyl isomerase